jgi:hypothetical protein
MVLLGAAAAIEPIAGLAQPKPTQLIGYPNGTTEGRERPVGEHRCRDRRRVYQAGRIPRQRLNCFRCTVRQPRAQLAALAAQYKVATIGIWRKYAADGGLVSYGTKLATAYHQVGLYAGKILNGARPRDLPSSGRPTSNWSST